MLTPGFLGYIRSKIQTGKLVCAVRYTTTTERPPVLQWAPNSFLSQIEMFVGKQHPLSTEVTCGYKPIQIAETSTVAPVKCLTTNIPLPPPYHLPINTADHRQLSDLWL